MLLESRFSVFRSSCFCGYLVRERNASSSTPSPPSACSNPAQSTKQRQQISMGTIAAEVAPSQGFAQRALDLFWGKPLNVDTAFGAHLVAPDFYPPGDLLIRDEYIKIVESIRVIVGLPVPRPGGLLVWGQPGIGETCHFVLPSRVYHSCAVTLQGNRPFSTIFSPSFSRNHYPWRGVSPRIAATFSARRE